MFFVRCSIVTCDHRGELIIAALTICERLPPSIAGKICLRSPPRTKTIPPNGKLLALGECTHNKSRNVLSRASKAILCVINASSHITNDVDSINSDNMLPRFISQIAPSSRSQGILKRECDVRPPGKSKEATPDEATVKMIFFCAWRCATIVFHKNVL